MRLEIKRPPSSDEKNTLRSNSCREFIAGYSLSHRWFSHLRAVHQFAFTLHLKVSLSFPLYSQSVKRLHEPIGPSFCCEHPLAIPALRVGRKDDVGQGGRGDRGEKVEARSSFLAEEALASRQREIAATKIAVSSLAAKRDIFRPLFSLPLPPSLSLSPSTLTDARRIKWRN